MHNGFIGFKLEFQHAYIKFVFELFFMAQK